MKAHFEMQLELLELSCLLAEDRFTEADAKLENLKEDITDVFSYIEQMETQLEFSERERDMMRDSTISAADVKTYEDRIDSMQQVIDTLNDHCNYQQRQLQMKEQIIEELEAQLPDPDVDLKTEPIYDEDRRDG